MGLIGRQQSTGAFAKLDDISTLFDGSKKLSRFSKPSVISPTPFAFKDKILQPISSQNGFKLSISDLSQIRKDGFESFIK